MRILRVADVPGVRTAGMQRVMYGTGDELVARGHLVDYLFREQLRVPGPAKTRRFTVPVHIARLVRAIARRGGPYDVVEIHEPLGAAYCLLRRAGVRLPPVTIYSHGLEECHHRALLEYERAKGLKVSPKRRWAPLSVVLQARYAVRSGDQVVCLNEADLRHLRRAGVPPGRLTKVPNGVSKEFLEAPGPGPERDAAAILFVGTWIVRKGILDLVEAATTVLSGRSEARLTVAGCGVPVEQVLADFQPQVRDRVTVIPHISDDRSLIECYRRHAVFVLPSVFEGYPLAMLEAACLGLCLVTTDVCGMGDFVESGDNGFKVPVGDPRRLADALLDAISDPGGARRLGEQARLKARAFSWPRAADGVLEAYGRAIRNGGDG